MIKWVNKSHLHKGTTKRGHVKQRIVLYPAGFRGFHVVYFTLYLNEAPLASITAFSVLSNDVWHWVLVQPDHSLVSLCLTVLKVLFWKQVKLAVSFTPVWTLFPEAQIAGVLQSEGPLGSCVS